MLSFKLNAKPRVHYGKGGITIKCFGMSPLSMFKILSPACVFPMCRLSGDGRSVLLRRLIGIKWMFETISVVVSSYMAPLSLEMLPLNIFGKTYLSLVDSNLFLRIGIL